MNQPLKEAAATAPSIDWKKCRISRSGNVLTPKCRISWPVLMVPEVNKLKPEGGKQYSVSLLLPPGCDLTLLKDDAKRAAVEKFGDALPALMAETNPQKKLKLPFLDAGDQKGMDDFKGWTMIRTATKETRGRPSCADANGKAIEPTPNQAYPGRWACVSLRAWAYDKAGNKGVSFGLQSIQLLEHDDPIAGSRVNAEEEFAPVEGVGGAPVNSSNDIFS